MKATLTHDKALRFIGTNAKGFETIFDTSVAGGGLDSAASPMDVVLEASAACTSMDVVAILQKKRRTIEKFVVELDATRAAEHPKVFTGIAMHFQVSSPDATMKDLTDAITLSHEKYCSVSIMLARSGCQMTWTATLSNSAKGLTEFTTSEEHEAKS